MPRNVGVKNALENMKELLDLYKKVIGNYRPLLDGERYLTDQEVAQILKVSRRTLQEYRNDGVLPYILLGGKVLYRESDLERVLESYNQFLFLQVFVAVDNLQGYVHQLYLEGDVGLVALADNPLVTVDVHDVVRRQVLHVDEREGGETHEHKNVTNKGEIVILELMGHENLQFILGQKLPFLTVGADMELRKRVTGNLAVVVCPHHNTLQPHTALPDSGISQSSVCTEVGGKVLDKLWCQFKHRHVCATVMRLDKLSHILS